MRATAFTILVLAGLAAAACQGAEATGLQGPCERLGLDQAEEIVREWVYEDFNPEMNPSAQFPLEEITTDRIWNRLESQVYTCQSPSTSMANRPLLIECGDFFDLGQYRGMGGREVEAKRVTDLDADGSHELVFLDTWGSGILRTCVVMYLEDGEPLLLQADKAIESFNLNLKLDRVSDQELYVELRDYQGYDDLTIGRVVLEGDALGKTLTLELVDYLPSDVLDKIWFDYGL